MKSSRMLAVGLAVLVCGGAVQAGAKEKKFKWVRDKQVSSDLALSPGQAKRVVPMPENYLLDRVQKTMTEDLHLALGEYRPTKHIQEAETTPDSVLPEEKAGERDIELADGDYRFVLSVRLKSFGGRTRLSAAAQPVYRIRDYDAEEDGSEGENSVEVKVKGNGRSAVTGTVFVSMADGMPGDYNLSVLPDAADRAALLVKSFMYLLDKRLEAEKGQ